MTWGVFDRAGTFHETGSSIGSDDPALAFRERVFALLIADDAITPDVVENMRSWPHPGFGAHIGATTDVPDSPDGTVLAPHGLLSYFVRPAVSIPKLQVTPEGKVVYRSDHIHPKHKANFRVFDPLEFLATVSLHIPDACVPGSHASPWPWSSRRSCAPTTTPPPYPRTRPSTPSGGCPPWRHS